MGKINSESDLRMAILELEEQRAKEGEMLKKQLFLTYEGVQPLNLLKQTVREAAASHELLDDLVGISIGMTAGYLSKVLFEGKTKSPWKKLIGIALQIGVTNAVAKNPEVIKFLTKGLINLIVKAHTVPSASEETNET